MSAVPLRSEYGPTLGELLAPRWRRASRTARALAVGAAIVVVAALVGDRCFPHARACQNLPRWRDAVSFQLPGPLPDGCPARWVRNRAAPHPRSAGGLLRGGAAAAAALRRAVGARELALYAAGYIRGLSERYRGFVLRGEGWTQVDSISAYAVYNVFFAATVGGREMYGRDVLLLPERLGAQRGVTITMLSAVAGNRQVTSPLLVGTKGALEAPLTSFALE